MIRVSTTAALAAVPFLAAAAFMALASPAFARLPAAIAAPGQTTIATVQGEGAQIYECKPNATGKLEWQFREPIATLILDGKTVGRHYAGPSWAFDDGSAIAGKVAASAPGATPHDIPWLRLDVVAHHGDGELSAVTTVQRINTKGGAMAGACNKAGGFLSVPYSAGYVFLRKP
jgi:hypothetical protein